MPTDMTRGPIFPMLTRFMLPLLIGDIFQRLYNMADTIIVGRTLGENALAAVGATGSFMYLVTGFSIGITAGFTVLTAQRYGAKDAEGVRASVSGGILLGLGLTALLTALFLPMVPAVLTWMNTPAAIFPDALAYMRIICAGTVCTVFYNLFSAYLRGVGNSRAPLFFLIFSACLNVGLDLLFIIRFGMGVAGAARATVLAQGISALLCALYIWRRVPELIPQKGEWRPRKAVLRFELKMGLPMALQYAITDSGIMIQQAAINLFGATAVAAFTAASKIQSLLMQGMIAMGQTMATYCGQNRGAGHFDRIKAGVRLAVIVEVIYSVIAMGLMVFPLRALMGLFFSGGADLSAMIPWASAYARICITCYIPLAMIFIFRSGMEGCGYAMLPLACGLTELFARGLTAAAGMRLHSFAVAAACDPAAWLAAGIVSALMFRWMFADMRRKAEPVRQSIS